MKKQILHIGKVFLTALMIYFIVAAIVSSLFNGARETAYFDHPEELKPLVDADFMPRKKLTSVLPISGQEQLCYKTTDPTNEYVKLAAEISGNDIEFLSMLEGENAAWDPHRKAMGDEDSWGYCQINRIWHSSIVDDPRFFIDYSWQMEQCYRLFRGGTRFFGADKSWLTRQRFTCPV